MSADRYFYLALVAGVSYIIATLPRAVDITFFGYYIFEIIPVTIVGIVSLLLIIVDVSKGLTQIQKRILSYFLLLLFIFFGLCFLGFITKIPSRYVEIIDQGWKTEIRKTVAIFVLEDLAYYVFAIGFFYKWWRLIKDNILEHIVFSIRSTPFILMLFFFLHVFYSGNSNRPTKDDLPRNIKLR